jgi:hypothetical protein
MPGICGYTNQAIPAAQPPPAPFGRYSWSSCAITGDVRGAARGWPSPRTSRWSRAAAGAAEGTRSDRWPLRIWPCPGRVCRCGVLMIRKSATSIRSGSGRGGCPARVYCCLTTPGRQGRARRAQRLPSRSRARARSQSSFWGGTWPRRPRGGQLPHSRLRPCRSVPGFAQSTSRLRRLSLCPLTPHRGPRWSGALVVSTASSR